MNIRLCFKVDEKVGMAKDELGNPKEAFSCIKAKVKQDPLPRKEYKDLKEGFRKILANQIGCDINLVTSITLNQYLNETEN